MPDTMQTTPDKLARICADTATEVERRRAEMPLAKLRARIDKRRHAPRGFGEALKQRLIAGQCGLIAEGKRASPSGGLIREGIA